VDAWNTNNAVILRVKNIIGLESVRIDVLDEDGELAEFAWMNWDKLNTQYLVERN